MTAPAGPLLLLGVTRADTVQHTAAPPSPAITVGTLAAIVLPSPPNPTPDAANPAPLADASDLLRRWHEHTDLVPVRFGTLFSDQAELARAVHDRTTYFTAALDRLSGREEWALRLVAHETSFDLTPPAISTAANQQQAHSGRGYLEQRRADFLRREGITPAIDHLLRQALQPLAPMTLDQRLAGPTDTTRRLLPGRTTAAAAILTRRADRALIAERLAQSARELHARSGCGAAVTGPWPAFSFVA